VDPSFLEPAVFLSASVPDPRRDPRYHTTADVSAIREAIVALATVVLPTGRLLFGGHPAVSPLILLIAQQLGVVDRVRIYQSDFFRSVVPPESLAFSSIVWTPEIPGDRDGSLAAMRGAMLADVPLRSGVFIGGMEGLEAEYALFRQRHVGLPAYAIASTGAAAKIVFAGDPRTPSDPAVRRALEYDLVYDALFRVLPGVG
jgi:SLOG cluster3 family